MGNGHRWYALFGVVQPHEYSANRPKSAEKSGRFAPCPVNLWPATTKAGRIGGEPATDVAAHMKGPACQGSRRIPQRQSRSRMASGLTLE